ncbi:PAS domain S-box protein [Synoicihabitans lomoniglobus]|uniref:histidine kinase n=1 Tax=Synoicihabitans lomoniglobus TaxID=2909285 RepID=A0AAF0CMA4_9BACT|nr:PAS domain S-box protein [Opitutaceae bacterium LMO-M01]WED63021.1 PAS domain S-box protein [Opitutaceae bacterium LMO-M01]
MLSDFLSNASPTVQTGTGFLSSAAEAGSGRGPLLAFVGASDAVSWIGLIVLVIGAAILGGVIGRRRANAPPRSPVGHALHLETMLDQTEALLWEAKVVADGDVYEWTVELQPSLLSRRLFPDVGAKRRVRLWRDHDVPEIDEMHARAREAILSGRDSYRQEFRILRGEESMWMREMVSIRRRGPHEYWCVGLVVDITDRRQAESARWASENSLTEILNRADCLLWRSKVTQREGEYQWQAFEMPTSALYPRLFGDRPVGLGAKLWSCIETPELADMNRRSLAALKSRSDGYEQIFPVINGEGRKFWLQEQVSIREQEPNEWHLVGVITDITERRATEHAVQQSERRYRSLFEHTPVAVIEADFTGVGRWIEGLKAKGVTDFSRYLDKHPRELLRGVAKVRLLSSNRSARDMFKAKSTRELEGRRGRIETASSLRAVRGTFEALWRGQNTFGDAVEIRDMAGAVHSTNMRWWVAEHDHGLDLSQSVMVFADVTELKQVEADLAAQREQLAVTLRSMKEGVVTADREGRVQFINAAAAAMGHVAESPAVNRTLHEVFEFTDERTGKPVLLPLDQVAQGDLVAEFPERTILTDMQGTRRLMEGQLSPVHNARSEVIGVVLVFRDITDRDRLERELVRATRLESVGVLAGGIAHDFNNILTTIVGNMTIAELDSPADGTVGLAVREAGQAALRAKDLTQQLLTFAKGGEPVREAVDLTTVIQEMAKFALHGSNVRAEFDLPGDLWMADADRGQIGRVVQNLILNGAQAMPEGGILTIKGSNQDLVKPSAPNLAPGKYLRIDITDTGCGIRKDHVSRIFDPYFSTKQSGSGLGLSAAYSIVRKHHGLLEVQSEPGKGSTFMVWLPVVSRAAPTHVVESSAVDYPPGARVLFMDDEPSIRQMTKQLLGRLGFEVTTTADGAEMVRVFGEARAAGRPFDLVMTDLTVPGGMGGQAALPLLKEIDSEIRVIVSSGYSSDPVMADHAAYGFWDVVSKPYKLPDLRQVLQRAFTKSK